MPKTLLSSGLFRHKLFRYLIAGGSAFIIEYGSFSALFYLAAVPIVASNTASFLAGLAISFALNRHWAFSSKTVNYKWSHVQQAVAYLVLATANLILSNIIVIYLHRFHTAAFVAKLTAVITIAGWNFIIFHKVIFAPKAKAHL